MSLIFSKFLYSCGYLFLPTELPFFNKEHASPVAAVSFLGLYIVSPQKNVSHTAKATSDRKKVKESFILGHTVLFRQGGWESKFGSRV